MTPKFWSKLMTLVEVKHYHNNQLIWQEYNVPNIFHQEGETYLLSLAFDTDASPGIPALYYAGLDNRTTLQYTDDLGTITGEPSGLGYNRIGISSDNGFSVGLVDSKMKATSGILTFQATGTWVEVSNVFLSTTIDNGGLLIASSALSSPRTLTNGDSMTIRIRLSFNT